MESRNTLSSKPMPQLWWFHDSQQSCKKATYQVYRRHINIIHIFLVLKATFLSLYLELWEIFHNIFLSIQENYSILPWKGFENFVHISERFARDKRFGYIRFDLAIKWQKITEVFLCLSLYIELTLYIKGLIQNCLLNVYKIYWPQEELWLRKVAFIELCTRFVFLLDLNFG